jgi:hypothetical protein
MAEKSRAPMDRRQLERRDNPSGADFAPDRREDATRRDYQDRRKSHEWRYSWLRGNLKNLLRD